ncbi:hypothetical protein F511_23716 [Dorcoceras hygrometricum]|uniref:Uncharacterized protein n=1 Tax=Dorcoceras hygrometricum TaxID=472368 RepID=A0A2Z7BE93_9LAMI|nr:hypothetical protein F511_23716 [Dorcoceras hygrometricum]
MIKPNLSPKIFNTGMSEAYERVRAGRLAFKGGELATRDKAINKKKKKKKTLPDESVPSDYSNLNVVDPGPDAGEVYTIDAAKKMKYDELFPVECKKFGYDPNAKTKSVEEALDDRVKKKADRYCK